MIARCRALAPAPADLLADEWTAVKARRFDLIFATLVLQHIEPAACRSFVDDFARMAPAVYVLTLSHSDFDANVLGLFAETALYEAGECVQVDHDWQTHQLRVLVRKPFDHVCRSADGGHYEVLLRTRAPLT